MYSLTHKVGALKEPEPEPEPEPELRPKVRKINQAMSVLERSLQMAIRSDDGELIQVAI